MRFLSKLVVGRSVPTFTNLVHPRCIGLQLPPAPAVIQAGTDRRCNPKHLGCTRLANTGQYLFNKVQQAVPTIYWQNG